MAPMVTQQDSIDLSFLDEDIQMCDPTTFGISFEEIESLAKATDEYDNTKLMEDNGLGVDLLVAPAADSCSVIIQPATPDSTFNIQELQPVTPEMFLTQPESPETFLHPDSPGTSSVLSPSSSQSLSPDPEYLQPVSPQSFSVEPVNYSQHFTVMTMPWQSSNTESSVEPVMSPYSVEIENEGSPVQPLDGVADVPKKRGRKPKYPKGAAPRRIRPRKTKVYELGPLADEMAEKKRKNAINAKLHRDRQKNVRVSLEQQLQEVVAERDRLLKQVEQLQQRVARAESQGIMLL